MNGTPGPDVHWPTVDALALLCSGGLDSAALLAEALNHYHAVHPLYIRVGAVWEEVEAAHLKRFLAAVRQPALRPLVELSLPVADLYGPHWSLTGEEVPDGESSDEAVYLPGRNVLLLSKALIWCHLQGVPVIAMAPLAANPFPDATPGFFRDFEAVIQRAIDGRVSIARPYAALTKAQVIHRSNNAPLQWTFSCIRPIAGRHCGRCNKCAERQKAFREAGAADLTAYAL